LRAAVRRRGNLPQGLSKSNGGDPSLALGVTLKVYVTASERSERGGLPQSRGGDRAGDPSLALGVTLTQVQVPLVQRYLNL